MSCEQKSVICFVNFTDRTIVHLFLNFNFNIANMKKKPSIDGAHSPTMASFSQPSTSFTIPACVDVLGEYSIFTWKIDDEYPLEAQTRTHIQNIMVNFIFQIGTPNRNSKLLLKKDERQLTIWLRCRLRGVQAVQLSLPLTQLVSISIIFTWIFFWLLIDIIFKFSLCIIRFIMEINFWSRWRWWWFLPCKHQHTAGWKFRKWNLFEFVGYIQWSWCWLFNVSRLVILLCL